jgi:Sulfotransferase family
VVAGRSEGFIGYLFESNGDGAWPRSVGIKVARAFHRDRWRFSARRLGAAVDDVPLDRPIFLLGTQGSGATVIGRCLRRSPAVVTVSGGWENWTGTDELGIVRNRMARLPRALWGSSLRSDIADATFGDVHAGVFACDELLPFYRATRDDADVEQAATFRRVLREHIAVFAPNLAGARFLDKTHAYTVKMPYLAALLDGTQPIFVLVVRNPYGACTWALERKPPDFRARLTDDQKLDLIAQHWANAHRIALDDAAQLGGTAVVRFEDFLARPGAVVAALAEFAGIDYDPQMVPGPGQPMPRATLPSDRKWYPLYVDNRLGRTTPEQRAVVDVHCHELAARFGYTTDGIDERPEPIEIVGAGPASQVARARACT